jgi:hypothetical protein
MEPLEEFNIYSDESRYRGERFLLFGALWLRKSEVPSFEGKIRALRESEGYINDAGVRVPFLGEFKWTKAGSKRYLHVYKKLIDIFFEGLDEAQIRTCIMLVDTQDPTFKSYNNINGDGFYRFLYQLYLHNSRVPGIYNIYPDRITNPTHHVNLHELRRSLSYSLRTKFSPMVNPAHLPVQFLREIRPIDSKSTDILQIVDVVMGAIGFYQNRCFEIEGANQFKVELMKYVLDKIIYSGALKFDGKNYLIVKSTRFNIWLFKPKNKKTPS